MTVDQIKLFIKKSEYFTEYLPIVDASSFEVSAYEANSRFILGKKRVSTQAFFKQLQNNSKIFFYLEQRNKKLQINNFNRDSKLFLHFDANIVKSEEQKEFWKNFLEPYRDKIVIDITENSADIKGSKIKSFSKWISKNSYSCAINNFAKEGSFFSFKSIQRTKYIKIDKKMIQKMKNNESYKEFIRSFISFLNNNDKHVVLTGIENGKDIKLAQEIGADYLQGYYFKEKNFSI